MPRSTRRLFAILTTLPLLAMPAACQVRSDAVRQDSGSEETRSPNSSYKPLVAGQTRAPRQYLPVNFAVVEVASGLSTPWALEFLPDNRILVTERSGTMRIIGTDGRPSAPVRGIPPVVAQAQGGLLDVALDPAFDRNNMIYWTYSEPRGSGNATAVAKGVLSAGPSPEVTGVQIIFRMQPEIRSGAHFGSRIAFAPDGTLFVSLGERANADTRVQAQQWTSHLGKIIHINPDGTVPPGNPTHGAGSRPEIWSSGHRNPQGLAFRPGTDELWEVEFGPRGGDELNRVVKGADHGWPTISYGIDYSGAPIGQGITMREGMRQPVYYWDPSISPSGITFYTGSMFPAWKDSLFIASLSGQRLVRLSLQGARVTGEEWLLGDRNERFRDVKQAPDGSIVVATESGKLLRLTASR